jgi:hypothetical protein
MTEDSPLQNAFGVYVIEVCHTEGCGRLIKKAIIPGWSGMPFCDRCRARTARESAAYRADLERRYAEQCAADAAEELHND